MNNKRKFIYTCEICSYKYSTTKKEALYGVLRNYHANPNLPLKIGYESQCPECGAYNFIEETPEDVQCRINRMKELQKEIDAKDRGVIYDVY